MRFKRKGFAFLAVVGIVSAYLLGGYHVVDSQVENIIQSQLNKVVIGPHNFAVEEDAKPRQIDYLIKLSHLIYDESLRKDQLTTLHHVKDQAETQDSLLRESLALYDTNQYLDMQTEKVDAYINQAYQVQNSSVRRKILRINQEVKDKVASVKRAEESMARLNESPSLANFYLAQSYIDAVQYNDAKKTLQKDINKIYSQLMNEADQDNIRTEKEIEEAIRQIQSREYEFEAKTSSLHQISPIIYQAYQRYPEVSTIILFNSQKIEVYENYQLMTQGIILSRDINFNQGMVKTEFDNILESDVITLSDLNITSNQSKKDGNLVVDPNFYESLFQYAGRKVIVIEGS